MVDGRFDSMNKKMRMHIASEPSNYIDCNDALAGSKSDRCVDS